MTITYALMSTYEDLTKSNPERATLLKKADVKKLIKENGVVVGVEFLYKGKMMKEFGPVILSTGGYAADFTETSLLKKYRPELWDLPTTNGDHCTGDGIKICLDIGANSIHMDKVQVHPTGLVDIKDPDAKVKFLAAEALRGVGGLLLDANGNRFADELAQASDLLPTGPDGGLKRRRSSDFCLGEPINETNCDSSRSLVIL